MRTQPPPPRPHHLSPSLGLAFSTKATRRCASTLVVLLLLPREHLTSLVGFYQALYDAPMFLTGEQVATLQGHYTTFGLSYQRFRNLVAIVGDLVWPVRPNVRKMQHVPELASILNPTQAQCYMEESYMGTTQHVRKKSRVGRYKAKVQSALLTKRLAGLLIRCEGL